MRLTKDNLRAVSKLATAAVAGGTLGYLFYYFYGCDGTCLISSKPLNSTLYGAFLGVLFSRTFKRNRK
ncbi:DUF6132 family protein [Pontibacter anaerobius]|uniref:DUF6132 family protein n=1 Tax=Pontibacter anaerobius TaxID=2993940 RepID=A0ABT3RI18_9BACT|nr:DUF6132 family protein [Pontibacter anaerobius]MCX2741440.1 DUF6132 family protein [Pontibacter anaerobius]